MVALTIVVGAIAAMANMAFQVSSAGKRARNTIIIPVHTAQKLSIVYAVSAFFIVVPSAILSGYHIKGQATKKY
jgi:hypothetical protein